MVRLRVTPIGEEPFEHLFEGDQIIIGRSPAAGLILRDALVSRQHTRLFWNNGDLFVEDLGSHNRTFLNQSPVVQPTSLKVGDTIEICGTTLQVEAAEQPFIMDENPHQHSVQTIYRSVSDVLPSRLESTQEAGDLRGYADRLKLLNDIHNALSRPITLDALLSLILDRVFDLLNPEQAAIFLQNNGAGFSRVANRVSGGIGEKTFYSNNLMREITENRVGALVLDARTDERFSGSESIRASGVRSLVAAPLLDEEGALGGIILSSRAQVRQFSQGDLELLVSLASVAAMRIRNIALAEEAAERRLLEYDMAVARQIQRAFWRELPPIPGYSLHGVNTPFRPISGDFYSVLGRPETEEYVILVADVAGKGIAASLLTASLEVLSSISIEEGLPPDEICTRVSRMLQSRIPLGKFVTGFLAALTPATGSVRYVNAGHNPPLHIHASGEVDRLNSTGKPMGLGLDHRYTLAEANLADGDMLLIYTDGITEAADPDGQEYGLDRLIDVCRRNQLLELDELARVIEQDVAGFTRGLPFSDDRTLVMVRRLTHPE